MTNPFIPACKTEVSLNFGFILFPSKIIKKQDKEGNQAMKKTHGMHATFFYECWPEQNYASFIRSAASGYMCSLI